MELLEPLAQSFDHTAKTLAGVRPDQLDAPTPCTEWDLGALVGHLMGVVTAMGQGARGEPVEDRGDAALEADLAAQFRAVADGTLAAWRGRGADEMVDVGAGPMPVPIALTINLLDTTVHGWDIARASGQDARLPDDLATTVLAVAEGFVSDEIRTSRFGPPLAVEGDASATDRLVAFLGRQP